MHLTNFHPTTVSDLPPRELMPGYFGRLIHCDSMTLAYWDIKAGSVAPEHAHPHEQVVNVLDGEFELVVAGQPFVLKPGQVMVVPPDVPHGGKARTDCALLDVFHPVREDMKGPAE